MKALLLMIALMAASNAFGVLAITISPIDATTFSFTATGSADASPSNSGDLILSGSPINISPSAFGAPVSGSLTYGGAAITGVNYTLSGLGFLGVSLSTSVPAFTNSFAGPGLVFNLPAPYASYFNPGAYPILGGSGAFISSSGTLTVMPAPAVVPEPSTYIAIAGFAGIAAIVIRRRLRGRAARAVA